MTNPDPDNLLKGAVPDRSGKLARAIAFLEKHIKVNETLSKGAGKIRDLTDQPNWERMAEATAAMMVKEISTVPQRKPTAVPGQTIGTISGPADTDVSPEQAAFFARRNRFVTDTHNEAAAVLVAVTEASPALSAKIAELTERYEWITLLAGGQQLVSTGQQLQAQADVLFPLLRRLIGEVLGNAGKAVDETQLQEARDLVANLHGPYIQYNTIVREVVRHANGIIDLEAWKAVVEENPQSKITNATVNGVATVLSTLVAIAQKASPMVWGVGAGGAALQLTIAEGKQKVLKWVRDRDIEELKRAVAASGADVGAYAFDKLNDNLALMAKRVLSVQKEHTSRVFMLIGVPMGEFQTVWAPLSTALVAFINAYYEARVDKLQKLMIRQGLAKKPAGFIDAAKEWFEDTVQEIGVERAKEGVAEVLVTAGKALTEAGEKAARAMADWASVELPDIALKGAESLVTNLIIKFAAKVLSLAIAKMPIAIAQPISGDAMLQMKADLTALQDTIITATP
jgi:hypothetical protein